MSSHFLIRVLPSERPRDASLVGISALLPGIDLGNECGAVGQAPTLTLAIQNADFDFRPIEPTGVFRGVVKDDPAQEKKGRRAFARFVAEGLNADDPFAQMPRANFLGSESFVETIVDRFERVSISIEVPRKQRPAKRLQRIASEAADRDEAITKADCAGAYTLTEIAQYFGIHQSTASRIARRQVDV